ncbi:MAG: hypothetical protein A2527_10400 [Candidatus Lambdaproteobacteria bacterium RIFOXYD2_FULL_50_16]|uniref:Uncharacterized protein n=1 Tax=Candidatus Lambdaproteobacteria bacterium RIFOXYD2_FULL_50_16 TaxID=1817772 RepID=A0A1F6GGI8_9PROT|nr:MAG: hypothetical protein A2527_10400 [Candidatus Lambdaproteobacteria bacterium RIFOXYD2_FULL_50_16]
MDDEIIELHGIHGTTPDKGASIQQYGFVNFSDTGQAGKGVYFWHDSKIPPRWGYDLAKDWVRKKEVKYCVCIFATITTSFESYLDMDDAYMNDQLAKMIFEKRLTNKAKGKVYDLFFELWEQIYKVEIEAFTCHVSPPNMNRYPYLILGFPRAHVAKNVQRIHIDGYENVPL